LELFGRVVYEDPLIRIHDSFDVAIFIRFTDERSMDGYLQDRSRIQNIRNVIMPLVEKITVFDFFERESMPTGSYRYDPQQHRQNYRGYESRDPHRQPDQRAPRDQMKYYNEPNYDNSDDEVIVPVH